MAQGGDGGRGELMEKLLPLSQSGLERLWLRTVQERGYLLPDKAQSPVPDHYVVPDFTYSDAWGLVFVDGPHHKQPLQQQLDASKRQALDEAGYNVIAFGEDTREWDAVFTEFRWLFGDGHGEQVARPAASPAAAQPKAEQPEDH